MAGYVYFMVDARAPTRFKIGMTRREPSIRLREYGKDARFLGVYKCSDCADAERDILVEMKKNGFDVSRGREYFEGFGDSALDIFESVCRATPCPMEIG